MATLIWIGAAVTLVGIAGLGYSMRLALRVRALNTEPDATRSALQTVLIWNMAGLGVAFIGLMMVVVAIILR
jgi:hypothetical protein